MDTPTRSPALKQSASRAYVGLRLPADLHGRVAQLAVAADRSVSAEIRQAIREHVARHDLEKAA